MSTVTYYVAISFVLDDVGSVVAGDAFECPNAGAAIRMAEAVARTGGVVGSLAFSRTGDPDTVAFEDAVVLKCAFRRRRPRCPAHGDHLIRSMTTRAAHELDGAVGCGF